MFSASVRGGQARHREQCPREGPHYRGCFWKSAPEEELPLRPRSWAGLLFHARRSPSGGLLGRGFGALCSHLGCSAAPGGSLQVPPTAWLPASATPSAAQGPLIPPALGNGARFREQWDFPFFGPARTPKLSTHTHTLLAKALLPVGQGPAKRSTSALQVLSQLKLTLERPEEASGSRTLWFQV